MLIHILSRTPLYAWAILAFLVWRSVVELRDREIAVRRIFVLPVVMLALSLHDMGSRFGLDAAALGAWLLGCAAAVLLAWKFSRIRISTGSAPDRVVVRGSVAPLLVMLAIFMTKYATGVMLVLQPARVGELALAICAVYGLFNGFYLGRLLRDVASLHQDRAGSSHTLPARRV